MTQYSVLFNEKSKTLTIKDQGDKPHKDEITQITQTEVGELADATGRPEPLQHLKNQMSARDIDWRLVTVKNGTDNERLDKLEKDGHEITDEDRTVRVLGGEEGDELRAPSEL